MKKFEYIVIRKNLIEGLLNKAISPEKELNELGEKGWELAGVTTIQKTNTTIFFLKREVK